MENIRLVQTRRDILNGWVVIADTKRFGKDAILFEGSYEQCGKWLDKQIFPHSESYRLTITGECGDGVYFDNDWVVYHRNGFIEQDWSKFGL